MASRYEKEDSKRRILSACVQLFLEKGYQKTTTVEILKKAGVTPSTFYNIYHTKGSILTELTEFMFGNQFNISGKIVGEETNPVLLYAVETCLQLTLAELNENLRENYEKEEIIMASRSSNRAAVPEAKGALDKFKYEVASELGVPLSDGYNGDLTSKQNGSVGGYMVKKMIEQQEKQMAGK